MEFWNRFAAKHPETAKWVREGGLVVIVSNLITVFKYLLLQFLPKAFASLPVLISAGRVFLLRCLEKPFSGIFLATMQPTVVYRISVHT